MSAPGHVYMAYIGASLDEVWRGITDGDLSAQYRGPCDPNLGLAEYGTRIESDWTPGALVQHVTRDGSVVADGKVIAVDRPHCLELTFHAHWDPELEAEGPVREVYRLHDELNGLTKLTVETYDVAAGSKTMADITDHVPFIISGLKTLLETGAPLAG